MSRVRILSTLALLVLILATAGVAAAKPGGPGNGNGGARPPKARITWSVARVEQSVAPGATAQMQVTLTSSADLSNVTLTMPGGIGKVLKVEPSSFASLKAGAPAAVTLTFTTPAEGAQCRGGVVQVRADGKSVPASLKVKLKVPGAATCAP
jgi:uncharacterized membrane protein